MTRLVHSVVHDTFVLGNARLQCAGADAMALLALPRKLECVCVKKRDQV